METAPAASPARTAAQDAQQRVVDQQLLQQQQAESAAAAKTTDQQVQRAQQRVDQQQREVRIQDAPGPAQTGVPGPTGIVPPANTNDRIQDAPGPAQTLPVPTQSAVPSTTPSITTPPQA